MYELKAGSKLTWGTPEWIVKKIARLYGGMIDLDPAGNRERVLSNVRRTLFPDSNPHGLNSMWKGNVYVNPPYGPSLSEWMEHAFTCYAHTDCNVVMLLPANTARDCWRYASHADSICFIRGRVRFHGAPNDAGFASALILWTADPSVRFRFEREWMDDGLIVRPVSDFS